ncbi:PepSY domain-containing protein [Pseudomonas sp. CDFA 602]|uniref:PepSY domain-containing protein n=1 Tax=Pseudomonas californiensis TaxID=2829823 RepID=UPI001E50CF75|nr:PepSY domain-containing protein [Pseudomonas californiensis]MCD5995570.1 PepSY domain-containing protein [Pseudomonas californiensis]MCD6001164.1 PepSY domain-containing protein [Pseudomonas californiensis]
MKKPITIIAALTLSLSACIIHASDVAPAKLLRLSAAGTVQPFETLDAHALAQHPGATITDTELENEYGKYVYKVELRDTKNVEWDLEIDAVTGRIFRNYQDN